MPIIDKLAKLTRTGFQYLFPGEIDKKQPVVGFAPTHKRSMRYGMGLRQVETDLKSAITDIEEMAKKDGRIDQILRKTAASCVKGGLRLNTSTDNQKLIKSWNRFERITHLDNRQKLMSDAGALIKQGNLALQVVLDQNACEVIELTQMPVDTIVPNVDATGRFPILEKAYSQIGMGGSVVADFPRWKLLVARLFPDNFSDFGSFGMPLLHSVRDHWRKLRRTEENLLLTRDEGIAKTFFVLENTDQANLEKFQRHVEAQLDMGISTFFTNNKGSMTVSNQGTNLSEITDITHLLDSMLSGSGVSKELLGYTNGASLSTIQAMSDIFYEGLDSIQDILATAYRDAFVFNLLLQGILPEDYTFTVEFVERTTETRSQRVDTALKMQAAGASRATVLLEMGLDPALEAERLAADAPGTTTTNLNIVPGNAPKGESALTVSTRS